MLLQALSFSIKVNDYMIKKGDTEEKFWEWKFHILFLRSAKLMKFVKQPNGVDQQLIK